MRSWQQSNRPSLSMHEFFQRKLRGQDVTGKEPTGYRVENHVATGQLLYLHESTDIRVLGDVIDLVERADRCIPPEPCTLVFCYFPQSAVVPVAENALRRPRTAWQALVDVRAIRLVPEDSRPTPEGNWFQPVTTLEPGEAEKSANAGKDYTASDAMRLVGSHTSRRMSVRFLTDVLRDVEENSILTLHSVPDSPDSPRSSRTFSPEGQRGKEVSYCVAINVLSRHLVSARTARGGTTAFFVLSPEVEPVDMAVAVGHHLIEAASKRDAAAVRSALAARADANARDANGRTALHAAASVRPCIEVFDQLLLVANPCIRDHHGKLACDLAENANNNDIARLLRGSMSSFSKEGAVLAVGGGVPQAAAR